MQSNQKIPEGWSVKKLGNIVDTFSGGTPLAEEASYYDNGSIPFIRSGEIYQDFTELFITEKGLQESSAKMVNRGDLLFALYGATSGEIAISQIEGAINQAILCIRPKEDNVHYLKNSLILLKDRILHKYLQGGQGNLSAEIVKSLKLLFPPLPEQEKIAEILGTWDVAIEKLSGLIEQKKLLKKGLMQKLLTGKTRLPGFTQPWKEVKLGEIGTISSAGVDKKIVEGEDLVELLNYMDVYKKDFLYKTDTSMTVSAPMRQIKNCNLRKGDIFFTPSSETPDDIAHSAVVMEDIPNGVYSYHIIRLRPTTLIDLKFSAYAFKTAKFYKQAYAWCEGSGQRYVISQDDFRNMKIYIPSNISEQHAIAEVLSTADDEINLLNQKLEAMKEQKKGLMQQLLTGQIRVKVN